MSESSTDTSTEGTTTGSAPESTSTSTESTSQEGAPKMYDEATVKTLRSEAASHRTKARDAEQRAAALETEVASYKEQVPTLETRATKAESEALRYRVALEAGLPKALADRLVGSDEETLKADAEVLKGLTGQNAPTLDLGQGDQGGSPPAKADVNAALRALARR